MPCQRRYLQGSVARGVELGAEWSRRERIRWDPKMAKTCGIEDRSGADAHRTPEDAAAADRRSVLMVKRDLRQWPKRDLAGVKRDHSYSTDLDSGSVRETSAARALRGIAADGFPLLQESHENRLSAHAGQRWKDARLPAPLWHSGCRNGFDLKGSTSFDPTCGCLERQGLTPSCQRADIVVSSVVIIDFILRSEGPAFAAASTSGPQPSES